MIGDTEKAGVSRRTDASYMPASDPSNLVWLKESPLHRYLTPTVPEAKPEGLKGNTVRTTRTGAYTVAAPATVSGEVLSTMPLVVSVSGVIGFIGLMVPHITRPIAGPLHAGLAVLCAFFGAGVLLGSDLLARTLLPPQELPVGVITSSIGALFVVAALLRRK